MGGVSDDRLALIADSHLRLTGRALVTPTGDVRSSLWNAGAVIVAHGTESDPVFFYGNRQALALFEMDWSSFVNMPSRLSAEALLREERNRLLERVGRDGYISDYAGIRVSSSGKRFRIEQAVVWNLIDASGVCHGQAATFDHWSAA
ncbi:MAG: MEKHLA domain-containing protein [Burkholderiales bacterium 28-67-8]|nr:MAG: MEKHLA domain-containing protein [Burkholderiales bacterium 28-67-8]